MFWMIYFFLFFDNYQVYKDYDVVLTKQQGAFVYLQKIGNLMIMAYLVQDNWLSNKSKIKKIFFLFFFLSSAQFFKLPLTPPGFL